MAASQNPLQGSLFKEEEKSSAAKASANNSSRTSNENLANQQLKDDAQLRPRSKKKSSNIKQLNDLDGLLVPKIA